MASTRFTCENITVNNLTSATGTLDITTTNIDENLTGAYTLDCQDFSIDSTQASNVTVTGASQDLTVSATGGSLNLTATEAAVDALAVNTPNGGQQYDYEALSNVEFAAGGTIVMTLGTNVAPDITANNGDFVCGTATRGLILVPANGTVVAGAVTTNGRVGTITNDAAVNAGATTTITVTNTVVTANSIIFIQSQNGGGSVTGQALLRFDVVPAAGSYTLTVTNGSAAENTVAAPQFNYFILN